MCDLEGLVDEILERGLSLDDVVGELRSMTARKALARYAGNQSQAARALRVDRTTFRRLVKREENVAAE